MSHSSVVRAMRHDTSAAAGTRSPSRSARALRSGLNPAIQGLRGISANWDGEILENNEKRR